MLPTVKFATAAPLLGYCTVRLACEVADNGYGRVVGHECSVLPLVGNVRLVQGLADVPASAWWWCTASVTNSMALSHAGARRTGQGHRQARRSRTNMAEQMFDGKHILVRRQLMPGRPVVALLRR